MKVDQNSVMLYRRAAQILCGRHPPKCPLGQKLTSAHKTIA